MRFKKSILFVALFVFNHLLFSQDEYRVKYQLTYKIDSTDAKNIQKEIMYLDITIQRDSYFRSESSFIKDSILQSKNPYSLFNISKPKFKYCILKNANQDKISIFHDYTAFRFKINEEINLGWKIHNDSTKMLLGYLVKKATASFCGRNYIAWFAPEIAIADGPYKFKGLPGLILEISDIRNHYCFKAFSLQKLKQYEPYLIKENFNKISSKEFKKFKEKIKKKPSLILTNPGIKIPKEGLDKYDRTRRRRNKKNNNPIELNCEE